MTQSDIRGVPALLSPVFGELKLRFTEAKPERLVWRLLFEVGKEKGTPDGLSGGERRFYKKVSHSRGEQQGLLIPWKLEI